MVQILLAHGANVDPPDDMGNTPLHHAVYAGHTRVIRVLVENGADIDRKVKIPYR